MWRGARVVRWIGIPVGFLLMTAPQTAGLGVLMFLLTAVAFALDTPAQRAERRRRRSAR
jgi:hypothetical protein